MRSFLWNLEDLIRVAANHLLRPMNDDTYSFDDLDKAVARLSGRDVFGKLIISIGLTLYARRPRYRHPLHLGCMACKQSTNFDIKNGCGLGGKSRGRETASLTLTLL
jgi:hypothetical protein